MKYDLHIHSKYSFDSVLEPKEIIEVAKKKGLDGIAITDHGMIKGGLEAMKYKSEGFRVIVGSEVLTEEGEVIGLFLYEEVKSRDIQGAIEEIKEQGGIVIVPHPFDKLRRSSLHITEEYAKLVDGVEGFNSRCVFEKYNREAIEFGMKHNLSIVGGSDAHFKNEIGNGGIITEMDIKDAILKMEIKLFGKSSNFRSPLILANHAGSKIVKRCKKTFLFFK